MSTSAHSYVVTLIIPIPLQAVDIRGIVAVVLEVGLLSCGCIPYIGFNQVIRTAASHCGETAVLL